MESTRGPARVYQDFEPSMEWVPEDDSDTLLIYLPSFAKEQLRVQLRARNLIISGERKLQQQNNNNNTWSRFRVEFPVSVNCDLNKISANFEGNILFVRQPKLKMKMIIPPPPTTTTSSAAAEKEQSRPQPLVDDHESQHHHHHKTAADIEDDQLAAKMGLETTGHQIAQAKLPLDTSSNKTTTDDHHPLLEEEEDAVNNDAPDVAALVDKQKTNTRDNKHKLADTTAKTALDGGRVFASSSCRNAVNTIVILLLGLVIGIYVSSWPTKLTSSPTVDVLLL